MSVNVSVFDLKGVNKHTFEVSEFASHTQSIYFALKAEEANRRQGTASVKNRSATRGGGKKPWRQKGLGRARAGTRRSPLWRGGGVVFGPQLRDYHQSLPRKQKRVALLSALFTHIVEGNLKIVEDFNLPSGKTKELAQLLSPLSKPRRVLLVLHEDYSLLKRAARNLPWLHYNHITRLSIHDVVYAKTILIMQSAFDNLNSQWSSYGGS